MKTLMLACAVALAIRGSAMWRTEVRGFFGADDAIFPAHDGARTSDVAAVSSIAVRF